MGMNGRIGRAREMARIRRDREAAAREAGIDVSDRTAVARFHDEKMRTMWDEIRRRNAAQQVQQ